MNIRSTMKTGRLALAMCAFVCLASSAAAIPPFVGLETLPGYAYSLGTAISGDGSVVVGQLVGQTTRAFRWTCEDGLVLLVQPPGVSESTANAVNADGSVIVGTTGVANTSRAFRWTALGGMQPLGALASPFGPYSYGLAVNADGSVVTGETGSTAFRSEVFRWEAGSMQGVGSLNGNAHAGGTGISADGSVIVGYSNNHAVRWTAETGLVDLGVLSPAGGGTPSNAYAVSGDGQVVVGYSGTANGGRAFRWTQATGMVNIGVLANGVSSAARGASFDGSVVVGSVGGGAFFWSGTEGLVDLSTFLPRVGVNLAGWILDEATGISHDGRTIVGTGTHNGVTEAWVARIPPLPCGLADIAALGGAGRPDRLLTSDDVIVYLGAFFAGSLQADLAILGGMPGQDGMLTADDIILFLGAFFAGCP